MGNTRGRFIAVAITLAALASFGVSPATAAPAPEAAAIEVRDTVTLAGGRNIFGMNLKPRAKVTDAVTGAPLVGVQVLFYLRGTTPLPHMCAGVTNALGIATCGGVREQVYVFQARGYRAVFPGAAAGDVIHNGSEDSVGLFGA